jgi:hypothetical protein
MDHCFQGNLLKTSVVPNGIEPIDDQASDNCFELQSIKFGVNSLLSYIGREAFLNCSS